MQWFEVNHLKIGTKISLLLALITAITLWASAGAASFNGGQGTP